MSLGSWEGLDDVRAGRLSEDSSEGAEWSSSEEERFPRLAQESPPSSWSARGAYWDEMDSALEENMVRAGQRAEKSREEQR